MNKVEVCAKEVPLPVWAGAAEHYCQLVLERLNLCGRELSVLFCGNRFIRRLNFQYRGFDNPTDVLSFPYAPLAGEQAGEDGFIPAGDIVISLEELKTNAKEAGIGADEELRRLLIHGILHLAGSDHAGNEATEPMLIQQEMLLKELPPWQMTI